MLSLQNRPRESLCYEKQFLNVLTHVSVVRQKWSNKWLDVTGERGCKWAEVTGRATARRDSGTQLLVTLYRSHRRLQITMTSVPIHATSADADKLMFYVPTY